MNHYKFSVLQIFPHVLTWTELLHSLKQCSDFRVSLKQNRLKIISMEFNHYQHDHSMRWPPTFEMNNISKNKNKSRDSAHTYWECKKRRSGNGCAVRITPYQHEVFLKQTCQHKHLPNPELTAVKKMKTNTKRKARNTDQTTNNIISANIAGAKWRCSS